jgi:hypothetical protein
MGISVKSCQGLILALLGDPWLKNVDPVVFMETWNDAQTSMLPSAIYLQLADESS